MPLDAQNVVPGAVLFHKRRRSQRYYIESVTDTHIQYRYSDNSHVAYRRLKDEFMQDHRDDAICDRFYVSDLPHCRSVTETEYDW